MVHLDMILKCSWFGLGVRGLKEQSGALGDLQNCVIRESKTATCGSWLSQAWTPWRGAMATVKKAAALPLMVGNSITKMVYFCKRVHVWQKMHVRPTDIVLINQLILAQWLNFETSNSFTFDFDDLAFFFFICRARALDIWISGIFGYNG